jgi:hypothetical protein
MRTVLLDRAIRALAALMFLLAPLPSAVPAARADAGLLSRELAAVALPRLEQAVLRDASAAVHLLSDRRRERGQPRPLLVTAFTAAVFAGLALRAAFGSRAAARDPGHRGRRAVAGPRAPPRSQRA